MCTGSSLDPISELCTITSLRKFLFSRSFPVAVVTNLAFVLAANLTINTTMRSPSSFLCTGCTNTPFELLPDQVPRFSFRIFYVEVKFGAQESSSGARLPEGLFGFHCWFQVKYFQKARFCQTQSGQCIRKQFAVRQDHTRTCLQNFAQCPNPSPSEQTNVLLEKKTWRI